VEVPTQVQVSRHLQQDLLVYGCAHIIDFGSGGNWDLRQIFEDFGRLLSCPLQFVRLADHAKVHGHGQLVSVTCIMGQIADGVPYVVLFARLRHLCT